jgi:hypothetical protein
LRNRRIRQRDGHHGCHHRHLFVPSVRRLERIDLMPTAR